MPLQRFTKHSFRCAVVVDVGGVEQRDASVERTRYHPMALFYVGVAPLTKHHGAERKNANLHTASTETSGGDTHDTSSSPACCLNTRLSQ